MIAGLNPGIVRTVELLRAHIVAAVRTVLARRALACSEEHGEIADEVANEVALADPEPAISPGIPDGSRLDLGLWIDDAPRLVLTPAYLDRLRALPLSHVAVMVERSGGGLDLTWSAEQLRRLAEELPDHERVLTLWPEPTQSYLDALRARLPALLSAIGRTPRGTYRVESDLEGAWKRKRVDGYASLAEAGAALVRVLDDVGDALSAPIEHEVTTFPAHLEAGARGTVIGERRLYLQTYAIAEARGERRDYDGPLGPARRPYEDVLRVRRAAEPGVEVCAGLAAWQQADWPGEPEEAMALAIDSARRAGVRSVRWWSSKHVIGAVANSYAARAIEAARPLSLRAAG